MNERMINTPKNTVEAANPQPDPTWRGIYQAGGLAMLISGLLVLLGSTLGSYLGATPGDSNEYLQALAAHPALAQVTYWVWGLYAIFLVPAVLGLYLSLKGINKNAMLVAAGLVSFFIVLDLGNTELNSLALVKLTQDYAAATSDVQRAAYLAAEHWGLATMPFASFFSWAGPSSGFIIVSFVQLKGLFGKNTARLGIIVNALGILMGFYFLHPVVALSYFLTPVLVLYGVWFIAVGRRLYRLG